MPITVTIDEEWITCRRGTARAEAVRWSDLKAVLIETTDQGPFRNDVFWVLVGANSRCVVPQEAEGSQALLAKLQTLAGFDSNVVVDAMGSAENRTFLCWRKPDGN
jgi:hypothetical protein